MADLAVMLGRGGYERSRIMPPSDMLLERNVPAENVSVIITRAASFGSLLTINQATGNDNNTRAQVRAGAAWATIGRAAWGSTNRAAPEPTEAADAGDVVSVAAGTYESTVNLGSRSAVLYTPVNQGQSGIPIRFVANGTVTLVARTLNAPIIGSDSQDYIEWYADVTQGHKWSILNGWVWQGQSAPGTVNIASDTGSVVLWGANYCLIEGVTVDGGGAPFSSNYNGVRLESCIGCTVRNNTVHNFKYPTDANSSGVTIYGGWDNVIEHNYLYDVNTGVMLKDTGTTIYPMVNTIRWNRINNYHMNGFAVSLFPQESTNRFYGNLVTNGTDTNSNCILQAGNETKDWFYNNTFYNCYTAIGPGLGVGARMWNNIFHTLAGNVFFTDGGAGQSVSNTSYQHNVYYNYTSDFFNCALSSPVHQTFAEWKTNFSGQDATSPISTTSDPVFVTIGTDFHLNQSTSPCLTLGRDPDTNAVVPAGCYITGSEVIGVVT